jgi:hypothetical protein
MLLSLIPAFLGADPTLDLADAVGDEELIALNLLHQMHDMTFVPLPITIAAPGAAAGQAERPQSD